MPADASGGDTGIFYNDRELPLAEAQYVPSLLGVPESTIPSFAGHDTLESNGDVYNAAGQLVANLAAAAAAQGGGDGGCTAVRIPSSAPNPTGVPQTIGVATGTDG